MPWIVEMSPEVAAWYQRLTVAETARVDTVIGGLRLEVTCSGCHTPVRWGADCTNCDSTCPGAPRETEGMTEMTTWQGMKAEYFALVPEVRAELDAAELVYEARKAAGLTQTELASRMGTRQGYVSALERFVGIIRH